MATTMSTPLLDGLVNDVVGISEDVNILGSTDDWKRALKNVVPCVLVLKVTQTRGVDTESPTCAYATGFIVDKARGIVLTNRHVVTPGPIVAEAIFLNREELSVLPLYMDPVHDFAFLRFDPSKLQYAEIGEVPLAPEAAHVGLDIRVVGNDSGEKISILAGTLARLDRDAPDYGRKTYNDFNTFYLQAASGTKGGSSGSPVIDCKGRCVGLNAGGKNKAASAYYLPLERIVRALRIVQRSTAVGAPWSEWCGPRIPRGDLQATFLFKGFDEVRRLGLRQETERRVREEPVRTHGMHDQGEVQHATGMLVVESVVPGGPGDGVLEAGDVLVAVNRKVVTHFLDLEEALDDAVGRIVHLQLERGSLQVEADVLVTDLHTVTPSSFLEVAGGSLHALSYQQARNHCAPVGQVYVAEPGYVLGRATVPKMAIITSLSSRPTPDLPTFAAVLRDLPHGARVPLEYYTFRERSRKRSTILIVDRQWYGAPVYWTRDDVAGVWHQTSDYPPAAKTVPPVAEGSTAAPGDEAGAGSQVDRAPSATSDASATSSEELDAMPQLSAPSMTEAERDMRASLVLLEVDVPLVALTDGVHSTSFAGNGLVVYHGPDLGLVLIDRNTVATGACDINLNFAAHPAEVAGRVRFLHPLHNFALVSYDPSLLPIEARRSIRAARLVSHPRLRRGDAVQLVGLTKELRLLQRSAVVTNATSAVSIGTAEAPRFRAVHEEVIKLDQDFGSSFSGSLTDAAGNVRALWGSYAEQVGKEEREWCSGLPIDVVAPWLERVLDLEDTFPLIKPPSVRVLDAELEPLLLSKAYQFGLPAEWVSRLDKLDPERRQVLRVRSTVARSHAAQQLRCGDMILAVNGTPITCYADIDTFLAAATTDDGPCTTGAAAAASSAPAASTTITAATAAAAPGSASASSSSAPTAGAQGDAANRAQIGSSSVTEDPNALASNLVAAAADAVAVAGSSEEGRTAAVAGSSGRLEPDRAPDSAAPHFAEGAASAAAPSLRLTVFRSGSVQAVDVRLGCEDGLGTDQVVHWCGAQLQAPHRSVREAGELPALSGVYISRWHHGSPAHRYGLFALHFISEVNGVAVPDMATFLRAVSTLNDGDFVRIKMTHLETLEPKVLSLKLDLKYWPTWELRLDAATATWRRRIISTLLK